MTIEQKSLSRKYITYSLFSHMFFLGAVWLYFYRIFITDQQVGILDGMAFFIGILAEVPSGALADKFGRGRLVRAGQILMGLGLIAQGAGSSFMPFFMGQVVVMVGASFASGADEALFFSKLKFDRNSLEWRKLVTRCSQAALLGSVFALVVGGALHQVNPRLPWYTTGIALIICALVIWNINDERVPKEKQRFKSEVLDYLKDIRIGFSQFRLPKLWIYVPIIVIVQGLFYAAGWGILRPILLDRFTFSPFWGSVAVAVASLMTVGILGLMHRYAHKLSEKLIITTISLAAAAGLLLSVANIGLWGFVVIFVLYAGEHILYPFMSEVLNNHAPETQRATVLSVASFLRMLPYVILAPIIGYLNTNGKLQFFLILWAVLILLAVTMYLSLKKRDTQIELK